MCNAKELRWMANWKQGRRPNDENFEWKYHWKIIFSHFYRLFRISDSKEEKNWSGRLFSFLLSISSIWSYSLFLFVSYFCRCYANIWLLVLRRGFDDKFDFSFISLWIFHSISTTRYRFPKTYFHFFSVDFCKKSFKKANTHKIVRYTIV